MENHLLLHKTIKECVVLGIPDKDGLLQSKAYMVLMDGIERSESLKQELTLYCKEKLAPCVTNMSVSGFRQTTVARNRERK